MKNTLYNLFIREATLLCYRNCLDYFPPGSRILDVGIGNGIMIRTFHDLIRHKSLSITGLDINRCYLDHCCTQIRTWGLERNISVKHEPVETYAPPEACWFDFILFSMSFMLLDDPEMVLDRIGSWLKPGGRVLFFQTMFRNRSPLMEFLKPRLRYITSVDFGRVIYEEEFSGLLRAKGITVDDDRLISRKWFTGEYRLIITDLNSAGFSMIRRGAVKHHEESFAPLNRAGTDRPVHR
ncbi:MAG TPA: methyltransferase domain-containing protein [Deltaproteobacteria bacterium]|nr:methyltransferase domain-containing protein [Deltaproteobacteria bacterium]HPR56347.1 methyltransferase domain-containing protein [Deltaproteobacteria bacterium]HXK46059.1 methyltransferase domain-containing protein [Deltaproteobacteria bacterium]